MAAAWMDESRPGVLFVVRGVGRPLWTGHTRHEIFFASTRHALEVEYFSYRQRLQKLLRKFAK